MELSKGAMQWKEDLAKLNHFIEDDVARIIDDWWESCLPLVIEGDPGLGKTSLAIKIAQIQNASFHRLQCHKSLGAAEALYEWNTQLQNIALEIESSKGQIPDEGRVREIIYQDSMMVKGILARVLSDENEKVLLLIDELDKVPSEESFEALLLEYLAEFQISVIENGKTLSRGTKHLPRTIITSNAGKFGDRESLSKPVLRRCKYLNLKSNSEVRQVEILRAAAPNLHISVVLDCVLFVKWALIVFAWEKPIAISESIMWVQCLQSNNVKQLTPDVVLATIYNIAKTLDDDKHLRNSMNRIFNNIKLERENLMRRKRGNQRNEPNQNNESAA